MLVKVVTTSILMAVVLFFVILLTNNVKTILFVDKFVFAVIAALLGIAAGMVGVISKRIKRRGNTTSLEKRHDLGSFWIHWGTSIGILLLMISGLMVKTGWAVYYSNLHYIGLLQTLLFGCYFLVNFAGLKKYNDLLPDVKDILDGTIKKYLSGKKWIDYGKYRASQKSAFLAFAILGCEILITGFIKILALHVAINTDLVQITTIIHDFSGLLMVLLLLIHVGLVLFERKSLQLLISWFTGGEVEHYHDENVRRS